MRLLPRMESLSRVDWWLVLVVVALSLIGLVVIQSATQDDPRFQHQFGKQALFVVLGLGAGFFCLLPHYGRFLRAAWFLYATALLLLLGLPFFGALINGARRWYALPGFSVQPAELAKLAAVVALAARLRFEPQRSLRGILVPLAMGLLPAGLVLLQPDLGSALVFAPIVLATCYAAGCRGRTIALLVAVAIAAFAFAYAVALHGYQRERIDVWAMHWTWDEQSREVRELLRGPAYQPWQALIAMGGGGAIGFGIGRGPQNRYGFLPYRSEDYVFAVVGEEAGLLGCMLVLALHGALVFGLLGIARRTRERFGRLLCVGVAAWLGSQSLVHAAVCCWLLPSTGLPMPLLSYGGSAVLVTSIALGLCLNVGSRREPVLAGDGYR